MSETPYTIALRHVVERDPHLGADLLVAWQERRTFFLACELARARQDERVWTAPTSAPVSEAFELAWLLDERMVTAVCTYAADPTQRELVEDVVRACRKHYARGIASGQGA